MEQEKFSNIVGGVQTRTTILEDNLTLSTSGELLYDLRPKTSTSVYVLEKLLHLCTRIFTATLCIIKKNWK